MTLPPHRPAAASLLLREGAHAARNAVATLRSVAQLHDDPEVAAALRTATSTLHVLLERTVAAAALDTASPTPHETAPIAAHGLIRLAARRARREGGAVLDPPLHDPATDVTVEVAGQAGERLLADLLHLACPESLPTVALGVGGAVTVAVDLVTPAGPVLAGYLEQLAAACGAGCELGASRAVVTLRPSVAAAP